MFHHHVKCPTSPRLTALTDPYFSVTLGRKVIESGFYVQGGKSYIHKDSRNKRKQLIWVLKKKNTASQIRCFSHREIPKTDLFSILIIESIKLEI